MDKVKDDVLKKVSGGKALQEIGKAFGEAMWSAVSSVLTPILNTLVNDQTYGDAAKSILKLLEQNGQGSISVSEAKDACVKLKSAGPIQANEVAAEYLLAVEEFIDSLNN